VNDVDLQLINNNTAQTWQPWVLNAFAHTDSLQLLPVRQRDSLNNVEQVSIDYPAAGNYTIRVSGYAISGDQPYAVTYRLDTMDRFKWLYPCKTDNLY